MLLLRVTCGDVLVGIAHFACPHGLAHAPLAPTADYARIAPTAQRLAHDLAHTRWWGDATRDFAAAFALRWDHAALVLEDLHGRRIPACSIVLLESPLAETSAPRVRVVADLRSDCAQRALLAAVSYRRSA